MSMNLSVSCSTIWIINAPSGEKKIVILVTFYQIAILMELGNNEIQLKKENGEEMRGNNY